MRARLAILCVLAGCVLKSQVLGTDTVGAASTSPGTYVSKAFGDSLCSSFVIVIKKEVALHKHLFHSEHVLVLEGEGEMVLGERIVKIRKGDLVFIPKNTPHSAVSKGKMPLKVVSVQAPYFDGKDRVMIESGK